MMTIDKVHWYAVDGSYYYSAWEGDECDHDDEIPEGNDPEEYLALEFPGAEIRNTPLNP